MVLNVDRVSTCGTDLEASLQDGMATRILRPEQNQN